MYQNYKMLSLYIDVLKFMGLISLFLYIDNVHVSEAHIYNVGNVNLRAIFFWGGVGEGKNVDA